MSSKPNRVNGRHGFINRPTYLAFKKKYPDADVTYKEYITILKASTEAIRDHILNNQLGFKLPYDMGYIAVDKYKPTKKYVVLNWPESRRLGRRVPILNLHSFGYMFKIKLFVNSRVKPLQVYKMNPHRILNRMLAKQVFAGKEYLEQDKAYFSKRFHIGYHLKKY